MRQNLGMVGPLVWLLMALPILASEQECGDCRAVRALERLGGRVTRDDNALVLPRRSALHAANQTV